MAVEPAVAYQVLGLPFGAPCPEVRKAFRRLSLKVHPDKSNSPTATADFQHLLEAYEVLKLPRIPAAKRPHEDDESQPSSHYNNNEPCGQHYPQTDSTDDDDGEDEVGDDEEPQDSPGPFGRNSDKWNYRWDFETGEWMHPQGWSSSEEDEDDCESQDDMEDQQATDDARSLAAMEAAAAEWENGRAAREKCAAAAQAAAAASAAAAAERVREQVAAVRERVAAVREEVAASQRAAAAAEAEAAQRRAPLLDMQRRMQEHNQLGVIAKSAAGLAAAREKSGQADLLKLLTKSQISLERLAQEAEVARLDHLRSKAEVDAAWVRHQPQEEREERRLKAFADKSARFLEAGRKVSLAEQKLNALNIRKAAEHRAAVSRGAEVPESNAAVARERQLDARRRAADLLSKATAGVEHHRAVQEEALRTSGVLQSAEEDLLRLVMASAKARVRFLSVLTPVNPIALDEARQKYQCARQELKKQQIGILQQTGNVKAVRFLLQAKETIGELQAIYSKM